MPKIRQRTGIPIEECERLSEKYDAPMVILFAYRRGERFNVVTYGQNKELCKHASKLGHEIADAILSGEVEP